MQKVYPEVVCPFCERKLAMPADYQRTHECGCGAKYFVLSMEDLYLAESEGAETLGVEPDQVEIRNIRNFDVLLDFPGQDPATGDWQALVFVRRRPETSSKPE